MNIGLWLTTPRIFDPAKLDETPFGGAERSALHLARELAWNHSVNVFCNCSDEYASALPIDLMFHPYSNLKHANLDVLIVVRADTNLLNPRRNGPMFGANRPKKIILLTGDDHLQPNNQILHDTYSVRDIDLIVTKSNWQRDVLMRFFPLVREDQITVFPNGVVDDIPESKYPKEPKFVYASTAFRGLHLFLDIWPEILKRIPEATLDCYTKKALYMGGEHSDDEFQPLYAKLETMKGISIKEPLPQKELHVKLTEHRAMLYPNTFLESSCNIALEAMAIGMPIVTSDQAGLAETVRSGAGILIPGDPESAEYKKRFVEAVVEVHKNPPKSAREKILTNYSWSKVAQRWEKLFDEWNIHTHSEGSRHDNIQAYA